MIWIFVISTRSLLVSSLQATQVVTTLLAQRRNEVKLHCLEKHADRTVWYGQRTNQFPFIIMAAIDTKNLPINPIFIHGENPRFKLEWETNMTSFSLNIANFNDSDEGFYYCSVRDHVYTILGSGYILTLEQGNYKICYSKHTEAWLWQYVVVTFCVCVCTTQCQCWTENSPASCWLICSVSGEPSSVTLHLLV